MITKNQMNQQVKKTDPNITFNMDMDTEKDNNYFKNKIPKTTNTVRFIGHSHQTAAYGGGMDDNINGFRTVQFGRYGKVSHCIGDVVVYCKDIAKNAAKYSQNLKIKLYGCETGQKIINKIFSVADYVRLNTFSHYIKCALASQLNCEVSDIQNKLNQNINNIQQRQDLRDSPFWKQTLPILQALSRDEINTDDELMAMQQLGENSDLNSKINTTFNNPKFFSITIDKPFSVKMVASKGILTMKEDQKDSCVYSDKYTVNFDYLTQDDNLSRLLGELCDTYPEIKKVKINPDKSKTPILSKLADITVQDLSATHKQAYKKMEREEVVYIMKSIMEYIYNNNKQNEDKQNNTSLNKFFMNNSKIYSEHFGFDKQESSFSPN